MYFPYPHYAQYYPHATSTMMPQPCEIPMNPIPPITLPRPELYAPTKRRRDEFDTAMIGEFEGSAAKRAKVQEVIFRIVVPARQIGKVIGKEGCRIQRIREDTKATIKIADSVARHEERVIIISSSKENDTSVTDAENALKQISDLILKEDNGPPGAAKVVSVGHVGTNTIRLLIAGSQAGYLIGISGQNIEKLRNSSGASITVLPPNQLPLCASAHESDRVVQISGDVPVVLKAIEEIGYQLRENPPKQVISFSPAYYYGTMRSTQPIVDPTSADYVTMEMMVSEAFIGGLIGRCGSNISRIRNESGATIKVCGGKGEQKDRHIQFGGTAQQVALAKQRVDEYLCSQMAQQTGQ